MKYKNIDLTPDTYKELLHEHYGIYVVKGVYPKMSLKHKVYFKLENTDEDADKMIEVVEKFYIIMSNRK